MAKYQNAKQGIKKLFSAAILQIIATVLAVIAIAFGVNGLGKVIFGEDNSGAILGISAILGLATLVISIIAFIFNLIGLYRAGKDEINIKNAFAMAIANIIIALVGGIVATIPDASETASRLTETISSVFELSIILFVCSGIANLFRAKGKEKLAGRSKAIITLTIIAFIVSIFFRSATFATFAPDQVGNIILLSIGGICEIVGYIMYLCYLYRAQKDL